MKKIDKSMRNKYNIIIKIHMEKTMKNKLDIIRIKEKTLVLMSAIPASGKSTFFVKNKIPASMIVGADDIRLNLFEHGYQVLENSARKDIRPNGDEYVFKIAALKVEARLSSGLTTFVDATLVDDTKRNFFASIAKKYNFKVVILAFDEELESVIARDLKREFPVGKKAIMRMAEDFQRDDEGKPNSIHELHVVDINTRTQFEESGGLFSDKYDVIGDIHGCYDELIVLIKRLGYDLKENGDCVHCTNSERKLIFLGDLVDRGLYSIKTLKFVKKLTIFKHKVILGNHDKKIVNFYKYYMRDGEVIKMHGETMPTILEFMKLPKVERDEIYEWLLALPEKLILDTSVLDTYVPSVHSDLKIAFCHAHICNFDYHTPKENFVIGDSRERNIDVDGIYDELYLKGINEYKLIRGHIPLTSTEQDSVISLDSHVCKGGNIHAIRLDKLVSNYRMNNKFNESDLIITQEVEFTVDQLIRDNKALELYRSMQEMKKLKLVRSDKDSTGLLEIYKYSKMVFFKKLWQKHHDLLKARGLVFDLSGQIVHHSFDKVFNYSEPNEHLIPTAVDIPDNKIVQAIVKLNGFLGGLTKHPILHNELLNVTSGSFGGDFTGYTMDLVKRNKHMGNLLKYFNKNPDISLMFEVIHEKDPHIIEYSESEYDIYLIGARGHKFDDKVLSEVEIDEIAKEIGLKRPNHFEMTFGELKKLVKECEIEGYMVRDLDTEDYICKFKSPYYLVTKFLGRLSTNQVKFMFNSPEAFKKRIDEEFFDIVDWITSEKTLDEFELMDGVKRIEYVRDLINNHR
jgi:predicted kinase